MNSEQWLLNEIQIRYNPKDDFPCLYEQYIEFKNNKPLNQLKVLHATPIFHNFLPKILPLIASNANLTIAPPNGIPYDADLIKKLRKININVIESIPDSGDFDLIYDCIGSCSKTTSKYGYVELTKSGEKYYEQLGKPWVLTDNSKVKLIEDLLGTSDGVLRAFEYLKYNLENKTAVLFGFGKVGKGIHARLAQAGVKVSIVEINKSLVSAEYEFFNFNDLSLIELLIGKADIIITATGVKGVLNKVRRDKINLTNQKQLLINVGAEDEFGDQFDESEIVNNKAPVNFILNEPTKLKYLDATFALHNISGVDLIKSSKDFIINNKPLSSSEDKILKICKDHGLWRELEELNLLQYV